MRAIDWSACALALALGTGVTACGPGVASTVASSRATGVTTPSTAPAAGPFETLADYTKAAGISQVPVHRGDPGAPTVALPSPAGWQYAGNRTPPWAYDAIVFATPAAALDPPTVIAQLTRLSGPVDSAKLFEYAPGELKNLPGFDAMGSAGERTTLSGFEAFQFGGTYVAGGVRRLVAQKTVVIPSGAATYVLQLNANGLETLGDVLSTATSEIDAKTRITR